MNKVIKIVAIVLICAALSGCVERNNPIEILTQSRTADPISIATPTPEVNGVGIREYTNLPMRWAQADFTVNGTIEFKDGRYYIECCGVNENGYYLLKMDGYADRVDVRMTDKYLRNYYGETDLKVITIVA